MPPEVEPPLPELDPVLAVVDPLGTVPPDIEPASAALPELNPSALDRPEPDPPEFELPEPDPPEPDPPKPDSLEVDPFDEAEEVGWTTVTALVAVSGATFASEERGVVAATVDAVAIDAAVSLASRSMPSGLADFVAARLLASAIKRFT